MNSLVYTKASIARLLKIKPAQVISYRVWAYTVWVHVKGCRPTLVSKKKIALGFVDFRKEGGKALEAAVIKRDRVNYTVPSSLGDSYQVMAMGAIVCTCEDYKKQIDQLGRGVCKHGYAVLGVMGFGSLADYQAARLQARRERLALA